MDTEALFLEVVQLKKKLAQKDKEIEELTECHTVEIEKKEKVNNQLFAEV